MRHQLFVLDRNIQIATQSLVDSHLLYLCYQSTSFLSSTISLILDQTNTPADSSLRNLPCTKMLMEDDWIRWASQSQNNLAYLLLFFKALHSEYTFRFEKRHVFSQIVDNIEKNMYHYVNDFSGQKCTIPPICMNEKYHTYSKTLFFTDISVDELYNSYLYKCSESYRLYYNDKKTKLFKWTKRDRPQWTYT